MAVFYITPAEVMKRKDLRPEDKAVFAVLMFKCRQTGSCFPGLRSIGEAVGLSKNKVAKAVKSLEKNGLIRVLRTKRKANVYSVSVPYTGTDAANSACPTVGTHLSHCRDSSVPLLGHINKVKENTGDTGVSYETDAQKKKREESWIPDQVDYHIDLIAEKLQCSNIDKVNNRRAWAAALNRIAKEHPRQYDNYADRILMAAGEIREHPPKNPMAAFQARINEIVQHNQNGKAKS